MSRRHAITAVQTPRRVLAAWVGLWALLLQVMVPVGQAVPIRGADGLPRTLLICSALQPRTVPGPGSQGSDQRSDPRACAVCMAFATGASSDLPTTVALPPRPAPVTAAFARRPDSHAPGRLPGLPQPRGPPPAV